MAPEDAEIFRVYVTRSWPASTQLTNPVSEFDNDLMLRMFRNATTKEAKVLCTIGGAGGSWASGRRSGYRFQTATNAAGLSIERDGAGIRLVRRNLVWAQLYFADFETLTLFYHAFLALRHSTPKAPMPKESEYWLDGESLVFSANIDDGGFTHKLRLLSDRESGCIRLAAAQADRESDVTVWTAFGEWAASGGFIRGTDFAKLRSRFACPGGCTCRRRARGQCGLRTCASFRSRRTLGQNRGNLLI